MRRQKKSLVSHVRARFSGVPRLGYRKALLLIGLIVTLASAGGFLLTRSPASAYPCPCNVFDAPTGQGNFSDGSDLELGFKFKSQIDGYITGVRFYKQGAMSGTHVGHLWQTNGTPMASATFTETASGWQDVTFSSPVAVTANTTYVASVSMPDGNYIATANYFTTDRSNFPLIAPSSTNAPGNGVFSTNAGDFPTINSGNSANYWIDVDFKATNTPTPPDVDTVSPTDGATGVALGQTLTATFDLAMNPNSFTSSSFIVKDSDNNTLSSSVSFNVNTQKASLVADEGFEVGKTYTATLKGGGGSAVQNIDGTPMASDYSWSFTATSTNPCPCSLKDRAAPAGAISADEAGAVELGVKVTPQTNGYITAVRFYKPIISTVSTHTANIWSSTGTNLATATSSNESDYGWQEIKLSTPLKVSKDTLYVVSFTTSDGIYMASQGGVSSALGSGYLVAYANGDSRNAATGSGNGNGVFNSTGGNYPGSTFNSSYYWIDAVFSTTSAPTIPLSVDSVQPSNGSYGVVRPSKITARLSGAVNPVTVSGSTVQVEDDAGNPVSGTVSYDSGNHAIEFTPSATLSYNKKYVVTLDAAITDMNGATLASNYVWNFTTGGQLTSDVNNGPGGPILVVTKSGDNYSKYYAEILRAEGMNYFDVKDLSAVTSSTLGSYNAVVLSETALSQAQADMFTDWVNAGGNLVAMRPDAKLASLLGLTSAGTTRSNQYLLVDTSTDPGQGIVSESIQFKGVADNYTLSGATKVATLYSDASTSTANPAATYREVGSNGGTAAAFTYDLAKSIIALHQGNTSWATTDRDGDSVIRTNDMYFGAKAGDVQPDYVDLNKVHIPQADEQQRLLVNIITKAAKDAKPMPRFWYLPHDYKAAVVLAGDDHGLNAAGGIGRPFNDWLNNSATNCSVMDWQCVRSSGYVYPSAGLTNARAAQYQNVGFELGAHPPGDGAGCGSYASYAALGVLVNDSITLFRNKYTSLPNQRTTRYHCYVWSDYDSQPRVDFNNGIRYDLNYVTYPSSWISTRPAIITGSGMNMRLTDASGSMLDVHQGVTNFENTVTSGSAISAVLDNATGSNGYYGIFGTHYDMSDTYYTTIYNNTVSHSVPMISSDQALTWLEGRDSSSFSNFSGSNGEFTFDIKTAEGAVGLRAMMPTSDAGGTLASIKQGGVNVTYQTQTIKGVSYAVFDAKAGNYTVRYSDYVAPSNPSGGGTDTPSGTTNTGSGTTGSKPKKTATTKANEDTSLSGESMPGQGEEEQNTNNNNQGNNSGSTSGEDKTIVQDAGSKDNGMTKWLVGFGLVGLIGGILLGLAWRRRHKQTPSW